MKNLFLLLALVASPVLADDVHPGIAPLPPAKPFDNSKQVLNAREKALVKAAQDRDKTPPGIPPVPGAGAEPPKPDPNAPVQTTLAKFAAFNHAFFLQGKAAAAAEEAKEASDALLASYTEMVKQATPK